MKIYESQILPKEILGNLFYAGDFFWLGCGDTAFLFCARTYELVSSQKADCGRTAAAYLCPFFPAFFAVLCSTRFACDGELVHY